MNQQPEQTAQMEQLLTQFWNRQNGEADPRVVGELLAALKAWIAAEIGKRSGAGWAPEKLWRDAEGGRSGKTRDEWLSEDASALALHKLWAALKKMKSGHLAPVADADRLHRYAVRTARHAWYEILRQESRQWNNVRKSILAWIQGGCTGYTIWQLSPFRGEKLVGLWEQRGQAAPAWDSEALCRSAEATAAVLFPDKPLRELSRPEACRVILAAARQPVALNELTAAVCILEGWSESFRSLEEDRNGQGVPATAEDTAAKSPIEHILETENVYLVWETLRQLPVNQRRVLLLPQLDAIETLEVYAGVPLGVIAPALELSLEQLSDLISRMPLSDSVLAELTGIKVQSVRNLRLAAKKALRSLLLKSVL
ncbi:MAG: hypothetical protein JOZ60_06260 [Verrucomicrobia bacterium]|nr:hypothetical protein [Verrucomicrobiota bacterium]